VIYSAPIVSLTFLPLKGWSYTGVWRRIPFRLRGGFDVHISDVR
jgi:hypothetical protein